MLLEDYFDFLAPNDIRLKSTRIGIESILYEYIHRSQRPEAIAERFRKVSLEQVYATILYYLHKREEVESYLADWLAFGHIAREAQEKSDVPAIVRLRQRKAQRETDGPST